MYDDKVTVIVPAYNVERYIRFCIDSIVSQTYGNLQILIVDDGSTDRTKEIVESYIEKDHRIKLICQKNGGPSKARNTALDNAEGDYIVFVDSDDLMFLDAIEYMVHTIKAENADILVCGYVEIKNHQAKNIVEENVNYIEVIEKDNAWIHLFDSKQMEFGTVWGSIYDKDIFSQVRFREGRSYEDTIIAPQLYDLSKKTIYSSKKVYGYYLNESSITHTVSKKNVSDSIYASEQRVNWLLDRNKKLHLIAIESHLRHLINCYRYVDDNQMRKCICLQLWKWVIIGMRYRVRKDILKETLKTLLMKGAEI